METNENIECIRICVEQILKHLNKDYYNEYVDLCFPSRFSPQDEILIPQEKLKELTQEEAIALVNNLLEDGVITDIFDGIGISLVKKEDD